MKKTLSIASILLVVMVLLCACGGEVEPTTEATVAEEIQLPLNTAWEMSAVLVDAQGNVLENMTLTTKVKAWEQEGQVNFAFYFHYPENMYNSVTGVVPKPEQSLSYGCSAGTSTETGAAGKRGPSLYAAFDLYGGCFIADFDDDKDVYLIAYRNPNEDVSALWAYFQDFFQMRPAEFPKVSG